MRLIDVDLALSGYKIPGEHTAEEIAETVGHARAGHLVEEHAAGGAPMSDQLLIELHDLVKPYHPQRGGWRKQQVYIRGAQHVPPPASDVPRYMEEWVRYVNKGGADPVEHAAKAHAGFEAVHPFLDGNGRTGRLLMNWMLLRAGYPPAIIQVEERSRYVQALAAATLPSLLDYRPMAQLLAERVDASLTLYLNSLDDAARMAGVSARRLRGLAAEGKLEAKRYGKRWITWPAALETYLRTRNPVGKPPTDEQ